MSTAPEESPWSLPDLDLPPREPLNLDQIRAERYAQPRTWKGTGKGATPPRLDSPRMVHLISVLENGTTVRDACAVSGIAERSLYRWLRQGETENAEGQEGSPCWHIWQAITLARMVPEVRALETIHAAAQRGGWRAAAWFLERRYPERWGRNARPEEEFSDRFPTPAEVDAKILRLLAEIPEEDAAE